MAVKNNDAAKAAEAEKAEATKPANIAPGTEMEASGAIIEEAAKKVNLDHPAVDNNPRAETTVRQNQIDFNDPTKTPKEATMDNLGLSSTDADSKSARTRKSDADEK